MILCNSPDTPGNTLGRNLKLSYEKQKTAAVHIMRTAAVFCLMFHE